MNRYIIIIAVILTATFSLSSYSQSGPPVAPMKLDTWLLNFGVGPGTQFWGNGSGFGPAIKVAAEKGMWEVGPGVFTLGGEFGFSYFKYKYGLDWNETWVNMIFAARSAYHYGWDVPGLDTYAGVPLGIGFSFFHDSYNLTAENYGARSHSPVYPYFGLFLGGSYFFNSSLGVNAEVGYNSTFANVGMVFRIK